MEIKLCFGSCIDLAFKKIQVNLSAVISFLNGVNRGIDEGKYVTAISLDIQKALDTVDHKKTT